MASEIHRVRERHEALNTLNAIRSNSKTSYVIHYSCESFYDTVDGRTARVTSIAVRNIASGQTHSFSIHKLGEQRGISLGDIENKYDALEREMLAEFYEFLRQASIHALVHWNMRDINYGFPAIEHRFKVLGERPFVVAEDKKFDLARALVAIYGRGYVGHGKAGRFLGICELNKITHKDVLTGPEEAAAFEAKEYVRLHQSTLRKVDMMANVFERAEDGSLKTEAKWREIYGLYPRALVAFVFEHWIFSLITIVVTVAGLFTLFK
jgi:hypothetical protein